MGNISISVYVCKYWHNLQSPLKNVQIASAQTSGARLPTPDGLNPCKDDDAAASTEKRVAPSLGAEQLACFASDEKPMLHGTSKTFALPVEHAVALSVLGGPYGREDLDALSKQHEDYLARLNSPINGTNSQKPSIESVKPVLVSINRMDDQSYAVVSIREYTIAVGGEQVRSIKANGAAMVLQGSRLVHIEIIRELGASSDAEDVRTQIAAWSRAVAADTAK
jgi:hypothetical protein